MSPSIECYQVCLIWLLWYQAAYELPSGGLITRVAWLPVITPARAHLASPRGVRGEHLRSRWRREAICTLLASTKINLQHWRCTTIESHEHVHNISDCRIGRRTCSVTTLNRSWGASGLVWLWCDLQAELTALISSQDNGSSGCTTMGGYCVQTLEYYTQSRVWFVNDSQLRIRKIRNERNTPVFHVRYDPDRKTTIAAYYSFPGNISMLSPREQIT